MGEFWISSRFQVDSDCVLSQYSICSKGINQNFFLQEIKDIFNFACLRVTCRQPLLLWGHSANCHETFFVFTLSAKTNNIYNYDLSDWTWTLYYIFQATSSLTKKNNWRSQLAECPPAGWWSWRGALPGAFESPGAEALNITSRYFLTSPQLVNELNMQVSRIIRNFLLFHLRVPLIFSIQTLQTTLSISHRY